MKAPTISIEALQDPSTEVQEGETISTTEAASDGQPKEDSGSSFFDGMLFPMAACFLVFWFIVIRPEKRQRKAREEMLNRLSKGDEVVTSGGIHGKVSQVKDDVVTVQVADGVRLRFALAAVQTKVEPEAPSKEEDKKD